MQHDGVLQTGFGWGRAAMGLQAQPTRKMLVDTARNHCKLLSGHQASVAPNRICKSAVVPYAWSSQGKPREGTVTPHPRNNGRHSR